MKASLRAAVFIILICTLSRAENLTGIVTNGTSGKPAAGDDVILLKLAEGMAESSRVKSDSQGRFSLAMDDANAPHLVRVVHQGITYHRMAPPGTTSVEVEVYDVAKKVAGVSVTADVLRFEAQGNEVHGIRLFAVENKSSPPRTQMMEPGFEFYLPDGAVVDSSEAVSGTNGQPLNLAPVPQDERNRYAYIFPIRPGETQFQLAFHMPYSGELSVAPKLLYAAQHFVVMLPKTMQFTAGPGASFKTMQNPRDPNSTVEVVSDTAPGQTLGFKISGTGLMSDNSGEGGGQSQADSRPGGGLGPPIDAPDPLKKYVWYILGLFAAVMTAGAIFAARRPLEPALQSATAAPKTTHKPTPKTGSMLLDALKEEIFQLELEHKQGRISHAEYNKAKAALDQTLERAVKRAGLQ